MDADTSAVSQEEPASFELLVELLRAPNVTPAEVDAFLVALARPIPSGESPRVRDELLRSIIQDERIRGLTGSDGRTVRDGASQLLRELRQRYGLELPPELRPEREEPQGSGAQVPLWSTHKGQAGLALIVLAGLVQLPLVLIFSKRTGELGSQPWSMVYVAATTWVPALVAVLGDGLRRRWLYRLGAVWLLLAGGLLVAGGLVWLLGDPDVGLIWLCSGVLLLVGTKLLDASKRP
jgi:hypothetical protein